MMEQIIDDTQRNPRAVGHLPPLPPEISIRHSLLVFTSRISTLNSLALAPTR
jgi:hypothetical protein